MRQALRAVLVPVATLGICGLASAADLPVRVKAPPPAPVYYNWTGFYLGVNLGGSWGHQSVDACATLTAGTFCDSDTLRMNGVIGGGQIGYNWQFAPFFGWGNGWVLGLEADIQGSGQRASRGFSITDVTTGDVFSGNVEDKLTWFGTVRGRSGIAFDRTLWYVTGGWAFGDRTIDGTLSTTIAGVPTSTTFSTSKTLNGWTVGAGVEWAFWNNWTAKFEYLHIDFTNTGGDFSSTAPIASASVGHLQDEIARAGVNYKF
jgi:outer membrane immunogenic protein